MLAALCSKIVYFLCYYCLNVQESNTKQRHFRQVILGRNDLYYCNYIWMEIFFLKHRFKITVCQCGCNLLQTQCQYKAERSLAWKLDKSPEIKQLSPQQTHFSANTKAGSEDDLFRVKWHAALTIVTTTHHLNIQLSAGPIANQVAQQVWGKERRSLQNSCTRPLSIIQTHDCII